MTATYESIIDSALQLNPVDRCRVAAFLWESVGEPMRDLAEKELEGMLNEREAEMDKDPAQEISHEAFMSHFAARRSA